MRYLLKFILTIILISAMLLPSNMPVLAIDSMVTSQEGIDLIKKSEGFSEDAYHNPGETYWTIGYGHYGADVYAGMTITRARGEELLKKDLKSKAEKYLNNFLKNNNISITQNQFDALSSFTFNRGGGIWTGKKKNDFVEYLKKGIDNYSENKIRLGFTKWVYDSRGKKLPGLVTRRDNEADLFLKSVKPSKPTITSVTPSDTNKMVIKWKSVSGASSYKLERSKAGENNYKTVKDNIKDIQYEDKSGLSAATKYTYRVYAKNTAGESKASKALSSYTKPNTPSGFEAAAVDNSKITLTWKKVSGATKYKVYRWRADQKSDEMKAIQTVTSSSNTIKYEDTKLSEGSRYNYKIAAVLEKADSAGKDILSSKTETKYAYTKFKRPTLSNGKINPGEAKTVFVKMPTIYVPYSNKYHYQVVRKEKGGSYVTVYTGKNVSEQTFTDKTVQKDNAYLYQIQVVRESDNKVIHRSDTFGLGPQMSAPTAKSTDTNKISLSWKLTSPESLTYIVKRRDSAGSETTVGTTDKTSIVDTKATGGQTYTYYIIAHDKAGGSEYRVTKSENRTITHQIIASKISLNKKELTLLQGENETLTATITPSNSTNKTVTWSSSDMSVATVSNGTVSAVSEGTAVITASTSNGKTETCTVTVTEPVAHTHIYGDWTVVKEATCTDDGEMQRSCTDAECEEDIEGHTETEIIPATGHSYSDEYQIIKEATCTEDGMMARVCGVCGDMIDEEVIPATGHTYEDEWTIEREPTCVEEGLKTRKCIDCDDVDTETIELIDHEYELTETVDYTDDEDGYETYTCKICGDSYRKILHRPTYVSVDDVDIVNSGEIEVPVKINANVGFSEFDMKVSYHSALKLKGVTAGEIISSTSDSLTSEIYERTAEIHYSSEAEITGDGGLLNLIFEVPQDVEDVIYDVLITSTSGDTDSFVSETEDANFVLLDGAIFSEYIEEIDYSPRIEVSSARTTANQEVEISVDLDNNLGFSNLGIEIDYDDAVMELIDVTPNNEVGASYTGAYDYTAKPYNMNWDSVSNNDFSGELAVLRFKLKDNVTEGKYPVTVSYYRGLGGNYTDGDDVNYNEDFEPLGLKYEAGNITVSRYLYGDINGDGSTNNRDATYMLRYLAKWDIEGIVESELDVDENGEVNSKDGTTLLRYLAGWDID